MKTITLEKVHVNTTFEYEGKTYIKKDNVHSYPDTPHIRRHLCVDCFGAGLRIAGGVVVKAKWFTL